jgi:hypothetical protein
MSDEDLILTIIELYPQYYKQISGNEKYKLRLTENNFNQIQKFVTFLREKVPTIGIIFIKNFLSYSFSASTGKVNHYGAVNKFPLSWIISKQCLLRFLKEKGYVVVGKKKGVSKLGNTKTNIVSSIEKNEIIEKKISYISKVNNYEENEKRLFYNTDKGRVWCIDFTTLFHPKSELCEKCRWKVGCRQLSIDNYGSKILDVRENG